MTRTSSIAVRPWHPAVVGVLLLVGLVLLVATAPLRVAGQERPLDAEEQAFVELINEYRTQNGAPALNVSPTLNRAALWMSEDMGANDYFSHTDSLGRDPFQRMADFGYNYNTWKGENLAAGSDTAAYTFELWRDSPGHNSNMLNPNFLVIGVARAYEPDSTYGWYWTTEFGGFDESGSPPPTPTETPPPPTPTETPPPPTPTETPPPPTPTETPPPPTPTETPPPPTPTETPLPPTPTETPPPLTPTATALPPTPTETPPPPTPTATPLPPTPTETPPTATPLPPAPTESPTLPSIPVPGDDALVPVGANAGIAPPIRHNNDRVGGEPDLMVRELVPGWNQVRTPARSMRTAEALPVENGKVRAIYAWDVEEGRWRRYLPGTHIAELNTLQDLPVDQMVWVLADKRFQVALPA